MDENNFKTISQFRGYVDKPDITNLDPRFLVPGSANVMLDYASRVISRPGYTLFGAAENGGSGIKSSWEWATSTGKEFALRVHDGKLEFYWNATWNLLKSGYATNDFSFAKIWDNTEKIDVLKYVIGDTNTYKWSGAVAKIASATATTITKQGVLTAKTTIAFVAGTPGSVAATITDSANGFVTAGFAQGDTLYVTGSTANSRNFTIASVTAGTITLIMSDVLTSEAVGATITLHNGEPTWASSRFLTTGTRKLIYAGVEYSYTGGEATDTLTGLTFTPYASITIGDPVWQSVIITANPGDIPAYFKADLIAVQLNQLILASTKSREVYISSTSDYTNFTLTSPRAPGDPAKVTMDDYATCIVPLDNIAQTTSSVLFGGGKNEFFQLSYQLSQDNTSELVRMIKFKTANGSGLISKGAIASVKNATVYISREPALDTLANVQNMDKNAIPLSDLIKNTFDRYDFTGCHVKYWKRAIYISVPTAGIVLIYDLMRNLWQPPWTMPIGRFAVIGDWLYGHSSVTNETYRLYTGTTDNGVFFTQTARFAYNNGGVRSRLKQETGYWSDGYISPGAELTMNKYYGYNGSAGKKTMTIVADQSTIVNAGSPMGTESMGSLDGLPNVTNVSLDGLIRFYQDDTMSMIDFLENFVEYTMSAKDGKFCIVAHGSNQEDSQTSPVSYKK